MTMKLRRDIIIECPGDSCVVCIILRAVELTINRVGRKLEGSIIQL